MRHRHRMTGIAAWMVAVIVAVAVVPAAAQPKAKYLDKETFFHMESVSSPQIAPDGSQVVFARGFVDIMKDQGSSNLWIIDVKGERLRQLTDGTWRDTAPSGRLTAGASPSCRTARAPPRFT